MLIIFAIYAVVCLWGLKANLTERITDEYLSFDNTQSIKGIFILLVFFSHFNSYVTFHNRWDSIYAGIVAFFGQMMVTLFLFYSGYGIMESIKKKNSAYINQMPKKRILATLIRFDIAVILFVVLGLILRTEMTLPKVFLSLIAWESVGNSNWYIFVVLLLYLMTYVSFKSIHTEKYIIPVIACGVMVCAFIVGFWYFDIKPTYWYDTALCYILGMLYSLAKEKIHKIVDRHWSIWWVGVIAVLAMLVLLKIFSAGAITNFIMNVVFAIAVVLLTMRIQPKNKMLVFFGKNLFEIYILQRIPMILFARLKVDEYSMLVYFVLCFATTLVLVYPFKCISERNWLMRECLYYNERK